MVLPVREAAFISHRKINKEGDEKKEEKGRRSYQTQLDSLTVARAVLHHYNGLTNESRKALYEF